MTDEEKQFSVEVNVDKAINKTYICMVLIIINLVTYIVPFLIGEFDFGIYFEALTLIFIIIARFFMSKYDEDRSKFFIILAMIPIGWLFIYDVINVIANYINDVLDLVTVGYMFAWQEMLTIFALSILYLIYKDLRKADNPEKYKESTDWFYETLDKKEDKND